MLATMSLAPLLAALPCARSSSSARGGVASGLSARGSLRGAALDCRAHSSAAAGRGALRVCAVRALPCSATRTALSHSVSCLPLQAREAGVGLMGNKAGMTSYFTADGLQVPVTVIALLPGNIVTQARELPAAAPAAARATAGCCPAAPAVICAAGRAEERGVAQAAET